MTEQPEPQNESEAQRQEEDDSLIQFQEIPALIDEGGNVHISEEVVSTIAGIAAMEIEGVAGLTGGFVGGITEMLGKRNFARGVRVSLGEREATLDLHVVVDYGARIPRVAERVQESVKNSIEGMTGLEVVAVNIHIQGVAFHSDEAQDVVSSQT